MWRFLNSIPRAFRLNLHNPRPSVGVCSNAEEEVSPKTEEEVAFCPFTGRATSEKKCSGREIFRINYNKCPSITGNRNSTKHGHCPKGTGKEKNTGSNESSKWWKSCQYDFWKFLQGSSTMLEALILGSAMLWGTESDGQKRRSRLLYRVLFTLSANNGTIHGIYNEASSDVSQTSVRTIQTPYLHVAIKDAAGAAHDATVNESRFETLDSALEEFQTMCTEYTAHSESLLGLEAAEKGDMGRAVQHLRSSCMMGNASACFNLGLCYETGSGVIRDLVQAKRYYEIATKNGHTLAMYNLGLLCLNTGTDDGNGDSMGGGGKKNGIGFLVKAAKAGLAEAQTYLGIYHMEENHDAQKAVPYFKAAAVQNDYEAQYFLGICYEQGWGVEKNECRAAQLYSQSASAGHDPALYNLAVFNECGLGGLPEDNITALDLYTEAAGLGNEQAKQRLEEIRERKQRDKAEESMSTFQYQLHSKDDLSFKLQPQCSSPLSPSVSSPNLSDYLNHGLSYLIGSQDLQDSQAKPHSLFDPGGDSRQKRNFHIGSDVGDWKGRREDDHERSILDHSIYTHKNTFFTGGIHRSNTTPNLSLIACN